jgi:hypothetical protein
MYLPRISSANPLPPGVGLIIIIIQVTSCLANIRRWSLTAKNATSMAFITKYREVQDRIVAVKALIQKKADLCFKSFELEIISSPAFSAELFHFLRTGNLKI